MEETAEVDLVNWVIQVSNPTDGVLDTPVTMTDSLVEELELIGVDAPEGWDCTEGRVVTCTKDGLAPQETADIRIRTRVVEFGPDPIENTAALGVLGETLDSSSLVSPPDSSEPIDLSTPPAASPAPDVLPLTEDTATYNPSTPSTLALTGRSTSPVIASVILLLGGLGLVFMGRGSRRRRD